MSESQKDALAELANAVAAAHRDRIMGLSPRGSLDIAEAKLESARKAVEEARLRYERMCATVDLSRDEMTRIGGVE